MVTTCLSRLWACWVAQTNRHRLGDLPWLMPFCHHPSRLYWRGCATSIRALRAPAVGPALTYPNLRIVTPCLTPRESSEGTLHLTKCGSRGLLVGLNLVMSVTIPRTVTSHGQNNRMTELQHRLIRSEYLIIPSSSSGFTICWIIKLFQRCQVCRSKY